MPDTVLVTEKEFGKAEKIFRQANHCTVVPAPSDEESLSAAVKKEQARAVIIGIDRYTGPLYRALNETNAGRGSIIVRFGVGHDGVDKLLARQNGIVVCNTPGVLDISVAEHTLWLMGNLARRISFQEARVRAGEFTGETGSELQGKRLGVLGFGSIGRRVAKMAHFGFGMSAWAAGASSIEQLEARENSSITGIQSAHGLELYTNNIDQLLRECDYLTLHLPATPATRHFINASRFELMKSTAMLVNTARGSLVDEAALYEALVGRRLTGAALDVFENEPYRPASSNKDLRSLPNVVLTPHVGSNTHEANRRMAEACLANVSHFLAGDFRRLTQVAGGGTPTPI